MNILKSSIHIIGSLDLSKGGPSYTVPRLAEELAALNWNTKIATMEAPSNLTANAVPVSIYKHSFSNIPIINKLDISNSMLSGIKKFNPGIIHVHGLWRMQIVYSFKAALQLRSPIVVSTRGMLGKEALAFSRLSKKLFHYAAQNRILSSINCFHATAESELQEIRNAGYKGPVAVIPNGIDINPKIKKTIKPQTKPFILSLGRLHPKKGLDKLIRSFSKISNIFPLLDLKIVGVDQDGYSKFLKQLVHQLGLENRVTISGPLYDEDKFQLMSQASLFVLPSLNENFGVTVIESLMAGTPVISSHGAPWSKLETENCGWWVSGDVTSLASCMKEAMSLSEEERNLMGQRGREWVAKDFSWQSIGIAMSDVYNWLHGDIQRPSFVDKI